MGGALAQSQGAGHTLDLRLALQLPREPFGPHHRRAACSWAATTCACGPTCRCWNTRGRVDFTQEGVQVVGANAGIWVVISRCSTAARCPMAPCVSTGQGTVSADGLRRATELGGASKLAASLQGQTAYRLQLGFNKRPSGVPAHQQPRRTGVDPARAAEQARRGGVAAARADPAAGRCGRQHPPRTTSCASSRERAAGPLPARAGLRRVLACCAARSASTRRRRRRCPARRRWRSSINRCPLDAWRTVLGRRRQPAWAQAHSRGIHAAPDHVARTRADRVEAPLHSRAGRAAAQRRCGGAPSCSRPDRRHGRVPRAAQRRRGGQVQARLSRLHLAAEPRRTVPRAEPTIDVAPSTMPAMDVIVDDLEWRGRKSAASRSKRSIASRPARRSASGACSACRCACPRPR